MGYHETGRHWTSLFGYSKTCFGRNKQFRSSSNRETANFSQKMFYNILQELLNVVASVQTHPILRYYNEEVKKISTINISVVTRGFTSIFLTFDKSAQNLENIKKKVLYTFTPLKFRYSFYLMEKIWLNLFPCLLKSCCRKRKTFFLPFWLEIYCFYMEMIYLVSQQLCV